jgi:hypothetical protein
MSATIKKVLTFTLITFLVVSFSGIASAKKKQGPVWYKGIVTKAAWTEAGTTCIEVDSEKYTFLPRDQVRITRQYRAPNGQWVSEKLSLDKINVGTEVLIRGEGLEILQLIVEERP